MQILPQNKRILTGLFILCLLGLSIVAYSLLYIHSSHFRFELKSGYYKYTALPLS